MCLQILYTLYVYVWHIGRHTKKWNQSFLTHCQQLSVPPHTCSAWSERLHWEVSIIFVSFNSSSLGSTTCRGFGKFYIDIRKDVKQNPFYTFYTLSYLYCKHPEMSWNIWYKSREVISGHFMMLWGPKDFWL